MCEDEFIKNSVNFINGVLENQEHQYYILFGSDTMFSSRKKYEEIINKIETKIDTKFYYINSKIKINELEMNLEKIKKQEQFKDKKIIFYVYNSFLFSQINEKAENRKANIDYLEDLNLKYGIMLLDLVTDCNNHIIPADFEQFNFSQLSEEKDASKNKIMWANMKIYDTDNKESKLYGKAPSVDHIFNIGDIVYLVYTNLPGGDKKLLLKGKILHNGYYDENYKFDVIDYITEDKKKKDTTYNPAIYIKIEQGIKEENLCKDDFNTEKICKAYRLPNNKKLKVIRNKLYLSQKLNSKLIKKLDDAFPKIQDANILKRYKKYFATECALKDCTEIKKISHDTFTRSNGTKYYEKHHLVERHTKSDSKDVENLKDIDAEYNLFDLCSNCHNRIHYGKIEDRKKMVKYLYDKNPEKINKLISKHFSGEFEKGNELEWIYRLYKIDK